MQTLSAAQIIDLLSMKPHPEGGHFVETFRDTTQSGGDTRSACTAIYYADPLVGDVASHIAVPMITSYRDSI